MTSCRAIVPVRAHALVALVILAAALLVAGAARAASSVWNESGDAGPLPASAQTTIGSGSLTAINGNLNSASDVDMYCIRVITPGSLFVELQCTLTLGPDLWMFDASGKGVDANTTCIGGGKIVLGTYVPSPGTYYVAVAFDGVDPWSAGGPIWVHANTGERAPDGPGAAGVVTSWQGTGSVQPLNPYTIFLSATGFCDASVPATTPAWGRVKVLYR